VNRVRRRERGGRALERAVRREEASGARSGPLTLSGVFGGGGS
jgi:hypothetical protein